MFAGLAISALVACAATTEFKAYSTGESIFVGQGGTKVVVDGMAIWVVGDPSRKFQVLGYIDDDCRGGLAMKQFRSDMIKNPREVGGDAVVQLTSCSRITGYYTTVTLATDAGGKPVTDFDGSMTMPVRHNVAKFAVGKFLD